MSNGIAPTDELSSRRDRLLQKLHQEGIDLAIISSPLSIHYLTGVDLGGFLTPQALILSDTGETVFVVRDIEMTWRDHWAALSWCSDWVSYKDNEDPYFVISDAAKRLHGRKPANIGLELDRPTMSHTVAERLISFLAPAQVSTVTESIEGMRRVKSATEIGFMRKAGSIAKAGVLAQAEAVRAGGRDIDAVAAGFAAMLDAGADLLADQPSLPFGPQSARAHGHWTGGRPAAGDVVTFFLAGSYGRYQCPIERTFVLGAGTSRVNDVIERAAGAQEMLQNSIEPGMKGSYIDSLARDYYEKFDLEQYRVCRIAYSIGVAYPPGWWENEIAQMRPNDDLILEPGMTFHLVPCLCVPGVGFVNRSMPTVITDNGCSPLIDLPIREQVL